MFRLLHHKAKSNLEILAVIILLCILLIKSNSADAISSDKKADPVNHPYSSISTAQNFNR